MATYTPPFNRLDGKYTIDHQTGCYNWTGSLSSQAGYPTIGDGQKVLYAHRVAWESINGPMPTTPCPDGSFRWELHHVCQNKRCINQTHIQLVTQREHAVLHKAIRLANELGQIAATMKAAA
ncbi:MAG: HNH endonuclease signature motif containing protein [Acidobacteriaceae bacterium]|nr:HNH endonuclease signature motif containing protein [Acidobacteriaceae bacterium]